MITENTPATSSLFINESVENNFFGTLEQIYEDWLAKDLHRKGYVEVTLPARLYKKKHATPNSCVKWKYEGNWDYATIRLWEPGMVPYYDQPSHFQIFNLRPQSEQTTNDLSPNQ